MALSWCRVSYRRRGWKLKAILTACLGYVRLSGKRVLSVVVASRACFLFSPWKASYKPPENTSSGVSRFPFEKNLLSCSKKSWYFCFGEPKVPWYQRQHQCILCILFWVYEQTCLMVFSAVLCSMRVQKAAYLVYSWALYDRNVWLMFLTLKERSAHCYPLHSSCLATCFAKLPFNFFFLFCWGSCSLVTLSRCSAWPCKLKTDAHESCLFKNKSLMSRIIKWLSLDISLCFFTKTFLAAAFELVAV